MRSQTEEQLLYCKKDGTKRKTVLIKQLSPDDSAEYINAQIATAEDGSRIIFETGRYHLNSQINICNKNDIIIDGNNSVFDPLYDKKGYSRSSVNAFNFENCSNLQIGMNYFLRHFYYRPCTFIFSQCSNVTAEDVKIHNIGGMGFLILPQCNDFVFRRITFSPLDISKQFFSGNADEIHIIGLTGKLLIENCCFENLGDDVINAHTQVINCRNIKQDSAEVYFNKVGGFVSPYWAKRGDTIRVYDSKTLKRKTDLIFSDFKDNVLYFKNSADLDINDYLVNDIYYPDNDLHHNNIHIHDNVFENIMLQPLTLSNCDNVRIHDNAFIGCKYPCNTAENSN